MQKLYVQTTGTPNGDGSYDIIAKEYKDPAHVKPRAEMEAAGKAFWLEFVKPDPPRYNPVTHHRPQGSNPVLSDTAWTVSWADPVAKTQQEMDAELAEKQDALMRDWSQYSELEQLLLRATFRQHNMIRELQSDVVILQKSLTDVLADPATATLGELSNTGKRGK